MVYSNWQESACFRIFARKKPSRIPFWGRSCCCFSRWNSGCSFINHAVFSSFSPGFMVQVLYIRIPPGLTYCWTVCRISRWRAASSWQDFLFILYLISDFLPNTPRPEQGKSAITMSAFPSIFSSNILASACWAWILESCMRLMFSCIRETLYAVRSLASTVQVPSINSAMWRLFPPGAAHTSRT